MKTSNATLKKRERAMARVFSALGDRTRLSLVTKLLAAGAMSVTALADGADVSRQAISKHLGVLEEAGLITHQRQGREVLYMLEARQVDEARAFLEAISIGWDQALHRLRHLVESAD